MQMIISEKQIMQLMDFVNDYALLLAISKSKTHATMFNNIRNLLDTITGQQSEELKVIE
jgi:hypothetical protein